MPTPESITSNLKKVLIGRARELDFDFIAPTFLQARIGSVSSQICDRTID